MIEIDHLTKRYGSHTAVSDLCLTVEPGQIYGFLGPNGAGKSTTMNIMTGCLAATEGTVRIDGHDIFDEPAQAKALIGYLPEQPPLYLDMTPLEYLEFVAQAKGVGREARKRQLSRAMEVTQIEGVKDRLIKNLSKGYKQRVGIATLELTVKGSEEQARAVLGALPGVSSLTCRPGEEEGRTAVSLETDPPADLSEAAFHACATHDLPILRMDMRRASLEDVFLELTAADQPELSSQEEEPLDEPEDEEDEES